MTGASPRLNLVSIKVLRHHENRLWSRGIQPATDPTSDMYAGGLAFTLPLARWSLLVTRRGAEPIRLRPLALRGRVVVARHRIVNRWRDLRASLAGFCNHCPHTGLPGGGYSFWRCALPAGHPGQHRARNYIWDAEGRTTYMPLPLGRSCDQPKDRYPVLTRRQARLADRWHKTRAQQHRAEAVR